MRRPAGDPGGHQGAAETLPRHRSASSPRRTYRQIGRFLINRLGELDRNDSGNWPAPAGHNHFLTGLSLSNELRKMRSGVADGIAHKVEVLGSGAIVNPGRGLEQIPFPNRLKIPRVSQLEKKLAIEEGFLLSSLILAAFSFH